MSKTQQRSIFVTVLAWIFIVLSGIFLVAAVLYGQGDKWLSLIDLLIAAALLITSFGLFKRWNWARRCAIGIMVLAILFGLFVTFKTLAEPSWGFLILFPLFGIPSIVISLLFGWFVKKLFSAPIMAEFGIEMPAVRSESEMRSEE